MGSQKIRVMIEIAKLARRAGRMTINDNKINHYSKNFPRAACSLSVCLYQSKEWNYEYV
jgi:hypothetical protein